MIAGVALVPVIVKVKVPAVVELQSTVAVPDPVTLLGVMAPHVRPEGIVSVNATEPVNPLRAVMVIVDVAEDPTVADGEVAVMVKSGAAAIVKVAVAVWVRMLSVPVIVTV